MRVAWVMPGIGVVSRGAEAFVLEIAGALEGRPVPAGGGSGGAVEVAGGERWEMAILSRGPVADPRLARHHQPVRAVPRDTRWLNAAYGATRLGRKVLDTLFLDPLSIEWYTASLAAFPALWRGGYDVVVMEGGLVGAWLCRLLRRLRGVPFVDVAHGVDPKWEGAFARRRPDRVVTFTRAAATMIAGRAPRAQLAVIPHGVDLDRFHPAVVPADPGLPRPVVLVAGAVDAHKRTAAALEAVVRLGRLGHPASLLVLGDGPEASALDRRAAERLPAERYRRLTVPRAQMAAWYRAADVVTLPSRTESFGLTYLEALACGRPCVAPDDGVRREVLGDAALYADPDDPDAYAAALATALDRVADGSWDDVPRRRAERFPVEATVRAWADLLVEVAREGRRSAPVAGGAA